MTTVVVCGAVANKHRHGGSVWTRMSWAESLRRLGFDVVFVEELADASAVDAHGRPARAAASANADVFGRVMAEFGFSDDCALLSQDGGSLCGLPVGELRERLAGAELLVNISGHLRRRELLELPRCRAFVDLDPGYTQIWHEDGHEMGVAGHDLYFTVGANVGTARCRLPTGGLDWRPIRQPVVLERWPVADAPFTRYTTVGSWRGAYGPVQLARTRLRGQGARVPAAGRGPPALEAAVRDRSRHPPGRCRRPAAAARRGLARGRV